MHCSGNHGATGYEPLHERGLWKIGHRALLSWTSEVWKGAEHQVVLSSKGDTPGRPTPMTYEGPNHG